jgi:CrcB protein
MMTPGKWNLVWSIQHRRIPEEIKWRADDSCKCVGVGCHLDQRGLGADFAANLSYRSALRNWRGSVTTHLQERMDGLGKYMVVGIGGFFGAIARYWLGGVIDQKMGSRFPYGTLVINISGSFLLGLIMTVLTERTHLSPNWRYLVPIGFIGAYTTFSTFEWETFAALRDGAWLVVGLDVSLSVVLGFIAVWLGVILGRLVV